ncbi:unnamed protein product [Linum trigynum]|uniref:Non-specific lipid-transfer protein n=1 Tax=Linum trigynum TaxID=586398 RepID=A0AAV2FSH5_9ROSI
MAATKLQVFVALMVVMVASRQPAANGAVTCGLVASSVAPCLNYITRKGPLVASCCGGVRSLNGAASSTPARREACHCLKTIAGSVPGINYSIAGGIPGRCNVRLPFPM